MIFLNRVGKIWSKWPGNRWAPLKQFLAILVARNCKCQSDFSVVQMTLGLFHVKPKMLNNPPSFHWLEGQLPGSIYTLGLWHDMVVWMRMACLVAYVWTCGPQLVDLFAKDQKGCNSVTRSGFWGFNPPIPMPGPVSLLCVDQDVILSATGIVPCLSASSHDQGLTLWNSQQAPIKCLLLLSSWCLFTAIEL